MSKEDKDTVNGDMNQNQDRKSKDFKSSFKFSLFKGENELRELIGKIKTKEDDKLCVVSIIGKSDFNANSCKGELIDESLNKNVFKGLLFDDKQIDDQILNEIEGYYDAKSKIIFLHLISPMDTDQMVKVLNKLNRKLKERGFLDVWSDLNLNTIKSILLMFLISHIVVLVTPSIQIDINFLQVFRLIDKVRTRTQSSIVELLREIPELNKNWINHGRPCSPRVVFLFEVYNNEQLNEQLSKHLNDNKRKYELYLEDQLYRFLRKSRIITNICSNALFAVCNQNDFVYISTKQTSIRDSGEFFNQLLHFYCDQNNKNSVLSGTSNVCNELLGLDHHSANDSNEKKDVRDREDDRSFYDFLWTHINAALTKGFDDNVGRHNNTPVFELPKLSTFVKTILCLKSFFFKQLNECKQLEFISNKLHFSLDTDNIFSEARCTKIFPLSISFYRDKLPTNYTQEIHEQRLNQTFQFFKSQVRGSSTRKFVSLLEQDCDAYWKNGHQVCGSPSLFNNHCMNPIHLTKSTGAGLSDTDIMNDNTIKIMDHNSGVKYISSCNCGHKQSNRDDPFSIKQANFDFYYNLGMKCNCNELKSFEFPVFEGSLETAKPALLNKFMNLDLDDDDDEDDEFYSGSYESTCEDETEEDEKISATKNVNSEYLIDKLQTQLESQPLDDESDIAINKEADDNDDDANQETKASDSNEIESAISQDLEQSSPAAKSTSNSTSTTVSSLNEDDLQILKQNKKSREKERDNQMMNEFSKTEYLNGMLNSRSPKNLLPEFNSWSLVCLGSSSIYSHNLGLQNQPGFISNCNFLLPWDVTVKIEHSGDLPKMWTNKKLPGIKNKKVLQDGTQFTVKIFVGMEYECKKGHRFICSKPNNVLRAQFGQIKETANQLVSSDMPLFTPCVCSLNNDELAQLMRVHIVTPKAPVFITINPRIQMSTAPCPIFYPMNINENKPDEMIKLTQSAYWVLRLPFVYEQMINSPITKIYSPSLNCGHFLKDAFGICKFYSKNESDSV